MNELSNAVEAIDTRKAQVLQVLRYPDATLSKVSSPVLPGSNISHQALKETLDDMVATMAGYNAIGLAAIQIGVPLRMLVVQDAERKPIKVINPRIFETGGNSYELEGCLSLPGVFVRVARPLDVVVEYFDENLEKHTTALDNTLGRSIQHEIDHLDGKTMLDRLSDVERRAALRKQELRTRKVNTYLQKLKTPAVEKVRSRDLQKAKKAARNKGKR